MPGSVDRRGKSWRARYRDPTGRQRARSFPRKLDAQRWLATIEIEKSRGEWLDPVLGQVTVGAWIREWFANLAHLKPSTRSRYDVAIRNQIQPVWEHIPLSAVHHGDVVRWASQLTDAGLAPSTVRYAYRVFSQALQAAVRDNRIAKNPAAYVKLPRIDPTEKRFLGHEQVEALAQACGDYATFIRFLAYTGLRWGEATAVKVRRLDPVRGRLEVAEAASEFSGAVTIGVPKSHQRRSVPLPAFLLAELQLVTRGKSPDDLIFTAPGGGPLRNSNFRRDVLDPASVAVGIPGLRPHDLRHTAASLAIAAGANVKGRPANARPRFRGHDARRLRRAVQRRPR